MFKITKERIIIFVVILLTYILFKYQESKNNNNIENYSTMYNVRGEGNYGNILKPFTPYIKPYTNAIFDKNWKFITLADYLPRLEPGFKFTQIPCPAYYEPHNCKYQGPDGYDDQIICWQFNRIL